MATNGCPAERGETRRSGQPYSKIAVDGVSDYIGGDPKLRATSERPSALKLQTWYDPQIAAVTSASDFDLRDLRRKPMTIYVAVAPGNIPRDCGPYCGCSGTRASI